MLAGPAALAVMLVVLVILAMPMLADTPDLDMDHPSSFSGTGVATVDGLNVCRSWCEYLNKASSRAGTTTRRDTSPIHTKLPYPKVAYLDPAATSNG